LNESTCIVLRDALAEQLLVVRFRIQDVGNHGEAVCMFVELFGRRALANALPVFSAREFRDLLLAVGAAAKQLTDPRGESRHVLLVHFHATARLAFALALPRFCIDQAGKAAWSGSGNLSYGCGSEKIPTVRQIVGSARVGYSCQW
jgi:hypothetical protein